jgi:hypothetical protein
MKKTLLAALVVLGTTTAATLVMTSAHAAPVLVCDNHRSNPYTGRYDHVVVPAGASCYMDGAVVLGNFKALHGAVDVYLIDTRVDRNIHIIRAKRDVKIGPRHCKYDPHVGNNVIVTRSHNVAICFTRAENNIAVTRNDGRIILRDDHAGQDIRVVDNWKYHHLVGDGHHRLIGAIRLRDNTAGRHIVVRRNHGRTLLMEGNSPTPVT